MQVSTTSYRGIEVVSIAGVIDSRATGPLCDTLVESVRAGDGMLIVDLSAVHLATRAGVRCFVVAAKLCESAGGAMRICGAQKPKARRSNFVQPQTRAHARGAAALFGIRSSCQVSPTSSTPKSEWVQDWTFTNPAS